MSSRLECDSIEWRDPPTRGVLTISTPAIACARDDSINTIYFGGGTPSVLSLDEVSNILHLFPGREKAEISFECNPEDITSDYVKGLFDLGVNRLSIGIQSLDDDTLVSIHRSSSENIIRALDSIGSVLLSSRRDLFQNQVGKRDAQNLLSEGKRDFSAMLRNDKNKVGISINTDFIIGLPHTKKGYTLESIKKLHDKYPYITHTSIYMLEEGLYPKEWIGQGISEKEMEEEYREICEYFDSIGWHHYEISSWARPGFECKHNTGYWDHTDYRGFGLSATSYRNGVRRENSHSFSGYYAGRRPSEETLDMEEIQLEKMIHDLRTFRLSDSGFDTSTLEKLSEEELIEIQDEKIILTPAGIFRENFILGELMSSL